MSYGQDRDYKGFEVHNFEIMNYTTLNLYVEYTVQQDGYVIIDSVHGGFTGWVFNLYFEPVDNHIVQNWNEDTGQLIWEQTFTAGVGKSYESALYTQIFRIEGALEVNGIDTDSMEVISIMNAEPKFNIGVRVFYSIYVWHILLMIISALVTLFQTKYGSLRKLIIAGLFPLIGPVIYLGVGLYRLIRFIILWAKGLKAPVA
ncbi:hypothetical protein BFP97_09755 [Roseivirga sp. 4D4]|nr:hypothetical protein BFP97_09755 [Roseivirga sp. 4D4]